MPEDKAQLELDEADAVMLNTMLSRSAAQSEAEATRCSKAGYDLQAKAAKAALSRIRNLRSRVGTALTALREPAQPVRPQVALTGADAALLRSGLLLLAADVGHLERWVKAQTHEDLPPELKGVRPKVNVLIDHMRNCANLLPDTGTHVIVESFASDTLDLLLAGLEREHAAVAGDRSLLSRSGLAELAEQKKAVLGNIEDLYETLQAAKPENEVSP